MEENHYEKVLSLPRVKPKQTRNHFTDILGFFGGWYVAMYVKIEKFIPDYMTVFVWIYIIIITCTEINRELFPYNNGILKGAFMDS